LGNTDDPHKQEIPATGTACYSRFAVWYTGTSMDKMEFGRRRPIESAVAPKTAEANVDPAFLDKCRSHARSIRNPRGSTEMAELLERLEGFDRLRRSDSTHADMRARENLIRPIVQLYQSLTQRT